VSPVELAAGLSSPDEAVRRRSLARAITLVESSHPAHRGEADTLLASLPATAGPTLRIGLSGTPGVGKSTLIEALGLAFAEDGHRVAVLAVDPSSQLSKGSILGDKTRMERLAVHPRAFVRPSPSGGTLGGVAAATRDAVSLVEAAGHDIVIVETVGVGQSEAAVAGMTDLFVLLQLPNAGDDLQAMKKGALEVADVVVVHKADLDAAAAARAVGQIESAARLVAGRGRGSPTVFAASALEPASVGDVRSRLVALAEARRGDGRFAERRAAQARQAIETSAESMLTEAFRTEPGLQAVRSGLEREVAAGRTSSRAAARRLVSAFRRSLDATPAASLPVPVKGPPAGGAASFDPGDLDIVRNRLATGASRVDLCDLPVAGPVVIKRQRPPRGPWPDRGMRLLARMTGLALLEPVPAHGGARGAAVELARLAALASAGVRVPTVLHAEPGFFVMRRLAGASLAERIDVQGESGFAAWWRGLHALADVHARGACLSHAFARNLIETPDGIAFIDFEDDPLETLTLEAAQARDWLMYLHSTAWLLDVEKSRAQANLEGTLVRAEPGVRAHLLQAARKLAPFRRLPASRRPLGREVLGLGALARLLA
jgi:LAO/AO transport system kinase